MRVRNIIDKILAVGGVLIVFVQVLYIADYRQQIVVVMAGIIINQIGVWRLSGRLLPERRIYLKLRAEVDHFLDLVRQLNRQAVEGARTSMEGTKSAMHESVERMVTVAGVEG